MSSRTIAKNSLMLSLRMFLILGVTLYTSRVVLNTLGVEDYGIYNVVGGVVAMLGFFNQAMSSATQRFLSYDIGTGDTEQIKKTFSAALSIHILIAICCFVLAETVGLWFVNAKLNLPAERMYAVNWVYQFSILSFLLGVIQVPYNALIIAHERMSVFAYISILDAALKLGVVYLLLVLSYDKLILYAILTFVVSFCIRMMYQIYCRRNFEHSKFSFNYDKEYYKTLLSYSGWSLFENLAVVAKGQGNNIVLNLFFGPLVNAAYGITMQVQAAVSIFVQNFQVAVNPQIIKSYASNNTNRSLRLIHQSSRFSSLLTLLIAFPILINTEQILTLWLKNVPEHSTLFVQLTLIGLLIETVSYSLMIGIQATGKIKAYQAIVGTLILLNLPLSYFAIRYGAPPEVVFVISIIIGVIALILRLFFMKKQLGLDVVQYSKEVFGRIAVVTLSTLLIWLFLERVGLFTSSTTLSLFLETFTYCTIIAILTLIFGVELSEKRAIVDIIKTRIKCRKR